MTTFIPPKKGVQFIFYVGLVSQASAHAFQSNPTLASGDAKVSIDGAVLANLGTLPAVTPASSKIVKVTLSTSEMNGDNVTVILSDAAGAEWDDLIINIQTAARQIDDLAFPLTTGRGTLIDTNGRVDVGAWLGTVVTLSGGLPDVNMKTITAGIIAAASFAANALDAVWATGARTLTAFGFSVTVGTNNDKTGYALSAAGVLAVWNQLRTDVGIVANSFGAKLRDWVLGTDSKSLVSTDAQDLSATLSVNAKLLNGATPNNLAAGALMGLVDDAITSAKIAADAIGGPELAASAITKIQNGLYSGTPPTAGAIADAVWDEAIAGHLTAGSTGGALNDLVPGAPIEMNAEITENP